MKTEQTDPSVENAVRELKKVLLEQHLTYSQARVALNKTIWYLAEQSDKSPVSLDTFQ